MERLGREPDPNKAPVEEWHFPMEIQQAFNIHKLLSDKWEGMSGTYLGKDWTAVELLLNIFEVEDKKEVILFLKTVDALHMQQMNDKLEQQRKADDRRSQARNKVPTPKK